MVACRCSSLELVLALLYQKDMKAALKLLLGGRFEAWPVQASVD